MGKLCRLHSRESNTTALHAIRSYASLLKACNHSSCECCALAVEASAPKGLLTETKRQWLEDMNGRISVFVHPAWTSFGA